MRDYPHLTECTHYRNESVHLNIALSIHIMLNFKVYFHFPLFFLECCASDVVRYMYAFFMCSEFCVFSIRLCAY